MMLLRVFSSFVAAVACDSRVLERKAGMARYGCPVVVRPSPWFDSGVSQLVPTVPR